MPQQGWIRYKKKSKKSYTVYIKEAIGTPTDYYKNHIYWNQAYWKDVVTAVASYPYEILVTLKDGTQKVFSGCININPIKAQTDYCATYPLLDDNWFGSYKKSSRNNPIVTAKVPGVPWVSPPGHLYKHYHIMRHCNDPLFS